jgi:hypothetical protein
MQGFVYREPDMQLTETSEETAEPVPKARPPHPAGPAPINSVTQHSSQNEAKESHKLKKAFSEILSMTNTLVSDPNTYDPELRNNLSSPPEL